MIASLVCTAAGVAAAALVAHAQRRGSVVAALDERRRFALVAAAAVGAIAGAYLLQLPADLLGWSWTPARQGGAALDVRPLGGRTVIGGLLGGWIAVERAKRRLAIPVATGDSFAAPLAAALALGRIGCAFAGCCVGRACEPAWWTLRDGAGVARLPVATVEALFHAVAAVVLLRAARRDGDSGGRRFAAYVALVALLRFVLEFARANPPLLLGLSWYQLLSLALLVPAALAWQRRRRSALMP